MAEINALKWEPRTFCGAEEYRATAHGVVLRVEWFSGARA